MTRSTLTTVSYYMGKAFEDPKLIADKFREYVPAGVEFDTMIGTGFSGSLVTPSLARELGVNWAVVRKPNVSTHGDYMVEGTIGKRWIFVDDFCASGDTFARCRNTVRRHVERFGQAELDLGIKAFVTEYVGSFFYETDSPDYTWVPRGHYSQRPRESAMEESYAKFRAKV
jgi:hypoxanthine phosphoribosyltransferase